MGADETQERPFVIEEWKEETLTDAVAIWNQVVEDGAAFPQTELLVRHSMAKGRALGFRILQFNAVVKSNAPALALYAKIGFTPLGVIPGGFLAKDGTYEDIVPHYIELL